MKKVLLFIIVCMSSVVMFAAGEHFQGIKDPDMQFSLKIHSVVYIDGVLQGDNQSFGNHLELLAFDQNGVCRSAKCPTWNPRLSAMYYLQQIWGKAGLEYTFMLYSHNTGDMLPVEFQNVTLAGQVIDPVVWEANGVIGSATNPDNVAHINFVTVSSGFEKEIYAYEPEDHWYLISSPVGTVDATDVDNLLAPTSFDLYYFDQADADGLEWVNYKPEGAGNNPYTPAFTQLVAGKGYLYASSDTITLVFNGPAHSDADTTINLTMTDDVEFKGWNLVGNPFAVDAYIDRMFYRMNADNTDLMSEMSTGAIQAMEGVFVIAENDQEEMTFSVVAPNPLPALALNLIESRGNVVDRAIVSFNGERSLPKFQLNPNHTKVYIPQENRDYAVVAAGEMGEMPVSFKAEKNGSYTLNFTSQEVSFAYLHLIDNKTGKDIDLLESPAYSFDALTTDYANRFKLVFATGNNSGDNFAFNSNGLWIISNDGEATLQVVDVTGRILSSETVSGCVSKAISAAPGVYMLRLINGDNMKVQKVVVK